MRNKAKDNPEVCDIGIPTSMMYLRCMHLRTKGVPKFIEIALGNRYMSSLKEEIGILFHAPLPAIADRAVFRNAYG